MNWRKNFKKKPNIYRTNMVESKIELSLEFDRSSTIETSNSITYSLRKAYVEYHFMHLREQYHTNGVQI